MASTKTVRIRLVFGGHLDDPLQFDLECSSSVSFGAVGSRFEIVSSNQRIARVVGQLGTVSYRSDGIIEATLFIMKNSGQTREDVLNALRQMPEVGKIESV